MCDYDPFKGAINGDSSDDELDDGYFFSQLLCHTKAELLVGSAKGLVNFKMVKNKRRKMYMSDQRDV